MKNILVIVGTRPEAIKLSPVVQELRKRAGLVTKVCSTFQHSEMLNDALAVFGIVPDYEFRLMKPGQTLEGSVSGLFAELPKVIEEAKPDCVVVQGDTTTAFGGALCAFYQKIPVAHVEAGLRTGDIYAPFPEEINRRMISPITRWHFAATERAKENLLHEGIAAERIHVTGNPVIDALFQVSEQIPAGQKRVFAPEYEQMILVTGHRRESFGKGLRNICSALIQIARRHPKLGIIYSVHPNPNVLNPVQEMLGPVKNILLHKPPHYTQFVVMMREAKFIISDSGGVQEEGPALGKPVLITREVTERPEAVESGCAKLVGTDTKTIVTAAELLLSNKEAYRKMAQAKNPFGDGHASERIADVLVKEL